MDKLIRSPQGTKEENEMVKQVGEEVDMFVRKRWREREWETVWFVNPPVSDFLYIYICITFISESGSPGYLAETTERSGLVSHPRLCAEKD